MEMTIVYALSLFSLMEKNMPVSWFSDNTHKWTLVFVLYKIKKTVPTIPELSAHHYIQPYLVQIPKLASTNLSQVIIEGLQNQEDLLATVIPPHILYLRDLVQSHLQPIDRQLSPSSPTLFPSSPPLFPSSTLSSPPADPNLIESRNNNIQNQRQNAREAQLEQVA